QLAENQQVQAQLRQQLEEAQKQLQAQKETALAEQSKLEARARELQAAHAEVEQKIAALTEKLAKETEAGKSRNELEGELPNNKQGQEQLRQQLDDAQKHLQALKDKHVAEHSKLEAGSQALESAQA